MAELQFAKRFLSERKRHSSDKIGYTGALIEIIGKEELRVELRGCEATEFSRTELRGGREFGGGASFLIWSKQ